MSRLINTAFEGDYSMFIYPLPLIYEASEILVLLGRVFDHYYTILALRWHIQYIGLSICVLFF